MKYIFPLAILLTITACKQRTISGKELEDKLIETMGDFLHKTLRPGTEFTIKDVHYYPETKTKDYLCEFHVTMRASTKDTTGIVAATISNDFKHVIRTR